MDDVSSVRSRALTLHRLGASDKGNPFHAAVSTSCARPHGNYPLRAIRGHRVNDQRTTATVTKHAPNGSVKARVFLSRSGNDRGLARQLVADLVGLGYEVWVQDKDVKAGDNFRSFMDKALRECSATIALLSSSYLASEWCRDEAVSAHRMANHLLIPLVIEEGLNPDGLIASFVYLDVVQKLAASPSSIATLLARVLEHGRPLEESGSAREYVRVNKFVTNIAIVDSSLLVGRDDDMKRLDEGLQSDGTTVSITALAGMGGVGKSWLARLYATRNRVRYRATWFIRSERNDLIVEDLASLGEALNPALRSVANREAVARRAVEMVSEATDRPTLLIFDNVESPETIQSWRPSAGAHVLITSRWSDWTGLGVTHVALDTLTPHASIALLQSLAPSTSDTDAAAIASTVGYLPLALTHAGAVLRRSRISAPNYLHNLSGRLTERPKGATEYPLAVRGALEANLEHLQSYCREAGRPDASQLLTIAAFCASDRIPVELLEAARSNKGGLADKTQVWEAVGDLETFSLVRVDWDNAGGPTVTVHRLVQRVMEDHARVDDQHLVAILLLVHAIGRLFPGGLLTDESKVQGERLFIHAEMALARRPLLWAAPKDAQEWFDVLSIKYLYFHYATRRKTETLTDMAKYAERLLDRTPERSLMAAKCLEELGNLLLQDQQYAEAALRYREAISLFEIHAGEKHLPLRLFALAVTLEESKQYAEAEEALLRGIAIEERQLTPNPETIATLTDSLGKLLHNLNRFTEAEILLKRSLTIQEEKQGLEHSGATTTLNMLGLCLLELGRLTEAEECFRHVITVRENNLGPDHEEVASATGNLASVLHDARRLDEAEPLFRRAMDIMERVHGKSHRAIATSVNNLGRINEDLGRLDEAEALYRRAVAIDKNNSARPHRHVAYRLRNLGRLLHEQNRIELAEPYLKQALEVLEAALPTDHPEVIKWQEELQLRQEQKRAADENKP